LKGQRKRLPSFNIRWHPSEIILYVRQNINFLNILFIYLTERERGREYKQGEWQTEGEGEAGSPLSRGPDSGLDPGTLGS